VRSHGGLVVADETYCGLGRLSFGEEPEAPSRKPIWGFESHGVVPDVVTVGKALGNGHPIAAVCTTKDIAKRYTSQVSYYRYLGGTCNYSKRNLP